MKNNPPGPLRDGVALPPPGALPVHVPLALDIVEIGQAAAAAGPCEVAAEVAEQAADGVGGPVEEPGGQAGFGEGVDEEANELLAELEEGWAFRAGQCVCLPEPSW